MELNVVAADLAARVIHMSQRPAHRLGFDRAGGCLLGMD